MPELPEVEALRRSLAPAVLGRTVVAVQLHRPDIVRGQRTPGALLRGQTITELIRRGKQLALLAAPPGPAVCIHLGMSGSVTIAPHADTPARPHTHLAWTLDDGSQLRFADARRFGGIRTFPSRQVLADQHFATLGPDALSITPTRLAAGMRTTRRGLKAALLDQALLAGLGNIYVDELLFRVRLHPLTPAYRVAEDAAGVRRMVGAMRRLLTAAAAQGGSSLRDYINARGDAGRYQLAHRVYGRADLPCTRCRATLATATLAGRTTVWCPACQPAPAARGFA